MRIIPTSCRGRCPKGHERPRRPPAHLGQAATRRRRRRRLVSFFLEPECIVRGVLVLVAVDRI